jgi:glycerol-3-phosphate acyltransferase PlsX
VEGRDVYLGGADVVVCDGFIGNVALKISEGLADTLLKLLKREISKSLLGRLGYLFLKPALANFQRRIDYAEYGGAPLLGVNGVCIICHGRSSARAIKNAIKVSKEFVSRDLNNHLQEDIERYTLGLEHGESSG